MQEKAPDLFDLYYEYYEETEPPIIFKRWSYITCLSAFLGRQFWLPFGENRIFPNCYTMLIGHPGTRKSTAIKQGKRCLSSAGYSTYSAEKTSKEKFLLDLEGEPEENTIVSKRSKGFQGLTSGDILDNIFGKDDKDGIKDPKEVFIVADEFNEFVGSGNLEFLSLLGSLWDWDDPERDYSFRLKNSKSVSIYQPTLTILSGNTHSGFAEAFPPQAIGQGFLSRMLLIYGEPSGRRIPDPPTPPESLKKEIIRRFVEIKKHVVGPATETDDAKHARSTIYRTWPELEDGRFKHYSGRRYTYLMKLCLICAASRCSTKIGVEDVLLANSLLTWAERDMPKALGEFGKNKDSDIAGKIMSILWEAREPVTVKVLLKKVGRDLNKQSDLGDIMGKLISQGQVQYVKGVNPGYLADQTPRNTNNVYVDFGLLKEHKMMLQGKR